MFADERLRSAGGNRESDLEFRTKSERHFRSVASLGSSKPLSRRGDVRVNATEKWSRLAMRNEASAARSCSVAP